MYNKKQRIAALVGVILLALLYIATLITAIFNFDGKGRMFSACLFGTIAIPIMIWVYIWLYGKVTNKRTMADVFPEVEGLEEAERAMAEKEANTSDNK